MPRMLRDIVRSTIAGQKDMRVLGEFPATVDLLTAVERTGADLVITDAVTASCEQVPRLLGVHPLVRVLGIADDGHQTYLYGAGQDPLVGAELSPDDLVAAMRITR
jgi:DNA-binding NarL/FixJ family response regulator